MTKGLVYYSDSRPDRCLLEAVQRRIACVADGLPIVAVVLKPEPVPFPDYGDVTRFVLSAERGYLTMFQQILIGLLNLSTDVAFLVEHDVLYAREHFAFDPPRPDAYFYNLHCWKVDAATGRAVTYQTKQTSQLCADRKLLIEHYRKRVERVEREGFTRAMGFEPGSHGRAERVDDVPSAAWSSAVPNIDIRHDKNLTASRWTQADFRDQRNCQGWTEADEVPLWGRTRDRFSAFLREHTGVAVALPSTDTANAGPRVDTVQA